MYHDLLQNVRFYELLTALDLEVAEDFRKRGCSVCKGRLHAATFPRKPRGGPAETGAVVRRCSFCCAVRDCRTRVTPPSFRFLGRKVFFATVVVLVSALRDAARDAQRHLAAILGVSRPTVARWRQWWTETFPAGPFWKLAAARFMPPVDRSHLPASLLAKFSGTLEEVVLGLLGFLGPITGGASVRQAF